MYAYKKVLELSSFFFEGTAVGIDFFKPVLVYMVETDHINRFGFNNVFIKDIPQQKADDVFIEYYIQTSELVLYHDGAHASYESLPMEKVIVQSYTLIGALSLAGGLWAVFKLGSFFIFNFYLRGQSYKTLYEKIVPDKDIPFKEFKDKVKQRLSQEELFGLFDAVRELKEKNERLESQLLDVTAELQELKAESLC